MCCGRSRTKKEVQLEEGGGKGESNNVLIVWDCCSGSQACAPGEICHMEHLQAQLGLHKAFGEDPKGEVLYPLLSLLCLWVPHLSSAHFHPYTI